MTANEFNQLDFEQQDKLLYEKGTKLPLVKEKWDDLQLYSFEDFFVAYRMPRDHDADNIHALETETELISYKHLLNGDGIWN